MLTGKCLLKMLSHCDSHKAVIKEIPWVLKKLISHDSLSFALFGAWSCVRVSVGAVKLLAALLPGSVLLAQCCCCFHMLGSLWTWATVNHRIIRYGGGVIKADKFNKSKLELISSLQTLRSWLRFMSTHLFASPFLEGNSVIYVTVRVRQLGTAISCWILFSDFTPH